MFAVAKLDARFRVPTLAEHDDAIDRIARDRGSKALIMRELVQRCAVDPTPEVFTRLRALPASVGKIFEQLLGAAGQDVEPSLSDGEVHALGARFRCPTLEEYEIALDRIAAPKESLTRAMRELCCCCCVDPGSAGAKLLFEEHPAAAPKIYSALVDLAGGDVSVDIEGN